MSVELFHRDGVVVLRLSNGPANVLSIANGMTDFIYDTLVRSIDDPACNAVIITGSGKVFCGGADLNELSLVGKMRDLFNAIEQFAKPIIMAINGLTLGGGVEMIMAGHYRITHSSAKFSLPEVTLGLLPGVGGTQRLPRLIGSNQALDMMLSGRMVSASEAVLLGLVDHVVEEDVVEESIKLFKRGSVPLVRTCDILAPVDCRQVASRWRALPSPTLNQAPSKILESVANITNNFETGLRNEARLFSTIADSETSKALRYVFFGERSSLPSIRFKATSKRVRIRSVGLIGASAEADKLDIALKQAGFSVARAKAYGEDMALFSSIDLLLDACAGEPKEKQPYIAKLEAVLKPDAIFAFPFSGQNLQCMIEMMQRPDYALGFQFVSCAGKSALLEVASTLDTAIEPVMAVTSLARRMGYAAINLEIGKDFIRDIILQEIQDHISSLCDMGVAKTHFNKALESWGMPMDLWENFDVKSAKVPPVRTAKNSENLIHGFLMSLIDVCLRLWQDGVAHRHVDLDLAMIHGFGFPKERGGPMFQAKLLDLIP